MHDKRIAAVEHDVLAVAGIGSGVRLEQAAESFSTSNSRIRRTGRSFRGREEEEITLALMVPFKMIQVSNRTPILVNCEAYAIHGIPGMIAR
jgi:hypothetical protein